MILAPHFLAGSAIGSKISKKRWIFLLIILALASHYLLDAIPHSEYSVWALRNGLNTGFLVASAKVLIDILAGLIFIIVFCRRRENFYYILAGGIIALLPDVAIYISWHWPNIALLNNIVSFGHFAHFSMEKAPLWLGVPTQLITVVIAVYFLNKKRDLTNQSK